MIACILKNINTSQSFFAEVFTYNGNKVVKMLLTLQLCHFHGKVIKIEFYVIQFHIFYTLLYYSANPFCGSKSAGTLVTIDRKSTRLNSSHANISYAVF